MTDITILSDDYAARPSRSLPNCYEIFAYWQEKDGEIVKDSRASSIVLADFAIRELYAMLPGNIGDLDGEKVALEIFYLLTESDVETLGDQKELCKRIANLLVLNPMRYALNGIIEQLRSCGYECEAGPLENNTAFQTLLELAEAK